MAIYDTAKEIINRVALQVGLESSVSPFASADPKFVQLCSLLGTAGMELIELTNFQRHRREATITTDSGNATGEYDLETDFDSLVNQTMWDRVGANPIEGPLSAQDWQYRKGSGLDSETIYMSFRLMEGKIVILPLPNPDAVDLTYEYMSNAWVLNGSTYKKVPTADADSILIRPTLIQAYLRCLWRESKGMPSGADRQTLQLMFDANAGKDTPGKTLSLTRRPAFPYLSADNLPDTGYGT